jgi:hypothetical protein
MAVFGGKFEGCKVLMENIIDQNPKNSVGATPFHIAVGWFCPNKRIQLSKFGKEILFEDMQTIH